MTLIPILRTHRIAIFANYLFITSGGPAKFCLRVSRDQIDFEKLSLIPRLHQGKLGLNLGFLGLIFDWAVLCI